MVYLKNVTLWTPQLKMCPYQLKYVLYISTASVVQWSEFLATERRCIVFHVRYELNLCMLVPGVHSASNRNEYQEHKNNNVSGE
jgi:hypothetical protein